MIPTRQRPASLRSLRSLRSRRGQSVVEYMLVISVLVISLVVAAYAFIGPFATGFGAMREDVGFVLSSGTRNGSGDQR